MNSISSKMVVYNPTSAIKKEKESYYGTKVTEKEIQEKREEIEKADKQEKTGISNLQTHENEHNPSRIERGNLLYIRGNGTYHVIKEVKKNPEKGDFRFLIEGIGNEGNLIYLRYHKFDENIRIQYLLNFIKYSDNMKDKLKYSDEIVEHIDASLFNCSWKKGKESEILPLSDTFLSKVFEFKEEIVHIHI